MTTYTVTAPSGHVEARGLSAAEAAEFKLAHDGAEYEVRHVPGHDMGPERMYGVFGRKPNAGQREWSQLWNGRKMILVYAASADEAWPKLAELVITADWAGTPHVDTDADHDAMMAALEQEQE